MFIKELQNKFKMSYLVSFTAYTNPVFWMSTSLMVNVIFRSTDIASP